MLEDLPIEILTQITAYLPSAQAVANLSQSCHRLHDFVSREGWKVFIRTRFPSAALAPQHGEVAHSLTTLSRNWDRRAFVSSYIEPAGSITNLNKWEYIPRWERPRGQTMGYRPVIDSYEEWSGGSWTDRREIVAWSAGAELVIRAKHMGKQILESWEESSAEAREDDIMAVKVLRPSQKESGDSGVEEIMFGTANGELNLLYAGLTDKSKMAKRVYATNGRQVRSADVSPSTAPILAAALSDVDIALYPVHGKSSAWALNPVSDTRVCDGSNACRVWSTRFLSEDSLAVGLGPSNTPLHVYGIIPSGLSREPIRKFGEENEPATQATVYPIVPLPGSSQASNSPGQVFLSGSYGGVIRLHDMRSPRFSESFYVDEGDSSAIYSLQPIARERLVAGTSRHSTLKIFDLRVQGGRAYSYLDARPSSPERAKSRPQISPTKPPSNEADKPPLLHDPSSAWSLFLNPQNSTRGANRGSRRSRRSVESPVYSISSPSSTSPSLFAGVEGSVVQLDMTSVLDEHPDPVFQGESVHAAREAHGAGMGRSRAVDVRQRWDPKGDVLNLAMFSQTDGQMKLRVQKSVGETSRRREAAEGMEGLDERWGSA
ncbi:hypothetical protein W97_08367 [Coniosporium apollinis CBS 100218]|uniref:F-box domain-containing protein n=1 Tax=Coniosporium apollinis (strain CBS 100218) TaxID=1168221 RepID=R7Z4W5_CONA1|nr:uncharacterized protein W97_08367 [Coniosporium apollinis CBS 100218]EON69054.1 hypothetical protein W97_08367 [Coniosporium apollinis CBS 100218]